MAVLNLNKIGSIETEIKVSTLLEALKKYREEHIADYKESVIGFEKAFAEKVKETVKLVKKAEPGKFKGVPSNFGLVVPVDNTEMYDQFIRTFESVSSDTLTLSIAEVDSIVNNSWDWVSISNSSFSAYNAKFAG